MAIRTYLEDGKKFFEVYVNGSDSRGVRVQRKRRGIESQRKAEQAEFELLRELAKLKEAEIPFRWDEWLAECLKRMKITNRPSTVENYEKSLGKWVSPRWNSKDLKDITKSDVYNTIFEHVDPKLSPHTRRTVLKMTRRIFEMAHNDGLVDRNPCLGIQVKVPEVEQKVLTNTEAQIFLREAKLSNHRFYPIWVVALMTGMRSGELFALKWTDLDFEGKTISVSKQWSSKTGFGPPKDNRIRVVPISDDLLKFLKELKLQHGNNREFVLPHLSEWQRGEQARITHEFCEAIGITSIKFHDLRATVITNLLSRGESVARVMSVVGHSQIKTTNGYLRKAGVEIKGVTEKLGYSVPEESGAQILSISDRLSV